MKGVGALDMMVLLSIGTAGVFGILRGFVHEIFSLAAWFAAFFAVRMLHAPATAALTGPVGSSGGAAVLALGIVFGGTLLGVRMAGRTLSARTKASVLGPIDRALGGGFGVLKGLLVSTLAFLLMSLVFDLLNGRSAPRPEWMMRSASYDLLRASSATLVSAIDAERSR